MDGVAFSIFGFDVYWYGLIIMMGILVGIVISTKFSKIRGYSSDMILDFILLAVPLGVIGARLYYVVFSWDEFAGHLDRIFTLQMQGLAIYGAVIGGIIAALIMAKWRKMSLCGALLDFGAGNGKMGEFFQPRTIRRRTDFCIRPGLQPARAVSTGGQYQWRMAFGAVFNRVCLEPNRVRDSDVVLEKAALGAWIGILAVLWAVCLSTRYSRGYAYFGILADDFWHHPRFAGCQRRHCSFCLDHVLSGT